jgi:hypothetical protein
MSRYVAGVRLRAPAAATKSVELPFGRARPIRFYCLRAIVQVNLAGFVRQRLTGRSRGHWTKQWA